MPVFTDASTRKDWTKYGLGAVTQVNPANGIFGVQYYEQCNSGSPTGSYAVGPTTKITTIKDGASNTILASENIQGGAYYLTTAFNTSRCAGSSTLADIYLADDGSAADFDRGYSTLMVWHRVPKGGAGFNPLWLINGPQQGVGSSAQLDLNLHTARPSSFHFGGVNATFADGHTQFVRESIDYDVYMQLMTPDNGASDMPLPTKAVTFDMSTL